MEDRRIWKKDFSLLLTSNMFYSVALYMLLPTVPLYVASLGGTDAEVGIVASAFSIASISVRFSINLFFAKTPKKKMLLFGAAVTAMITLLYFPFRSIWSVCIVRIVQGFGFGIVSTLGTAMAADSLPEGRRGEGIGYYLMGTSAMMAVSPAIGLFTADNFGYIPMFLTAAAGPAAAFGFSAFLSPFPVEQAASAVADKTSPTELFFDRRLLVHTVLLILMGVSRSAESNFISLFAQERQIAHLSYYYVVQTVTTFLMRGTIGRITDRKGFAWSIIPGAAATMGFLLVLSVTRSTGLLLLAGVLGGVGLGTLIPSMQAWMFAGVEKEKSNLASAMFFNFYDIGIGIGSVLLGSLAGVTGYARMFLATAVCPAMFLAIYLIHGRRKGAAHS